MHGFGMVAENVHVVAGIRQHFARLAESPAGME